MPMTTTPSRTWRLQAFTEFGQPPRIEFLRERVRMYDDGGTIHDHLPTVVRALADVASTPIAGGPVVCNTMGDVFALVAACGHQLAAEDDARAAAAAAAAQAAAEAAAEEAARRAAAEPSA